MDAAEAGPPPGRLQSQAFWLLQPLEGEAAFLSRQACGPLLLGCCGLIGGWG